MYFQEDTVLRMIEMLGAAFGRLLRLLDDLDAEGELDDAYRRLAGIDRKTAEGMSTEALIDLLPDDRRLALCELLAMECQRFAHKLDSDVIQYKLHRALLLLTSCQDETVAKLRAERAKELFDLCPETVTAAETATVLDFLVRGGAFADAEDVLFAQLHSLAYPADLRTAHEAGLALYRQLRQLPEALLSAGNLPREEVAQGEAALAAWASTHLHVTKENPV